MIRHWFSTSVTDYSTTSQGLDGIPTGYFPLYRVVPPTHERLHVLSVGYKPVETRSPVAFSPCPRPHP